MAKGFRTPKEKIEKVVALANTTMTQKRIASECGVSERTVSRIWERAGIQHRRTPETTGAQRSSTQTNTAPPYRQQAKAAAYEQHVREVCELAERLRARLVIPQPIDLYTDFMQRVPAEGWYWHRGKAEIRFPEDDDPTFASLKQHTENMSFWQRYMRLKEDWAELGTQCQRLLIAIKVEVQRLTGQDWTDSFGQVGATEGFAVSAYYDAVYSVQGGAGLPQLYAQEGETGLRFAGWIIAWALSDQHLVLQQAHQELRNTFARHQLTKDVVTTHEKLTQEANHLRVELLAAKVRKLVLEQTSRCDDCR